MEFAKIKKIIKNEKKSTYDITVHNNHNFFANGHLLHNCFYSGEVHIDVHNVGPINVYVEPGDKIAQMILTPALPCQPILCPDESDLYEDFKLENYRNEKGFGSSDKKAFKK